LIIGEAGLGNQVLDSERLAPWMEAGRDTDVPWNGKLSTWFLNLTPCRRHPIRRIKSSLIVKLSGSLNKSLLHRTRQRVLPLSRQTIHGAD